MAIDLDAIRALYTETDDAINWHGESAITEAAMWVPALLAEVDRLRAAIERVRALHSPKPGWEREWKDPAEALANGWPMCAGCDLPGVGMREIGRCPTRRALDGDVVSAPLISADRAGNPQPAGNDSTTEQRCVADGSWHELNDFGPRVLDEEVPHGT